MAGYPVVHHCYQHNLGSLYLKSFTLGLQLLLFPFMVAKLPFSLQNSFIDQATRMLMVKNETCSSSTTLF